ncbi:hypothetical protein [Streptomyces sp. NPDC060366]
MELITNALPEFLGSLAATLVLASGRWSARRFRARRTTEDDSVS